jgi:hypothetical protein
LILHRYEGCGTTGGASPWSTPSAGWSWVITGLGVYSPVKQLQSTDDWQPLNCKNMEWENAQFRCYMMKGQGGYFPLGVASIWLKKMCTQTGASIDKQWLGPDSEWHLLDKGRGPPWWCGIYLPTPWTLTSLVISRQGFWLPENVKTRLGSSMQNLNLLMSDWVIGRQLEGRNIVGSLRSHTRISPCRKCWNGTHDG